MQRVSTCAAHLTAAAMKLGISAEQAIVALGMAARIISQDSAYAARHASPIINGRRCLNQGFDSASAQQTVGVPAPALEACTALCAGSTPTTESVPLAPFNPHDVLEDAPTLIANEPASDNGWWKTPSAE